MAIMIIAMVLVTEAALQTLTLVMVMMTTITTRLRVTTSDPRFCVTFNFLIVKALDLNLIQGLTAKEREVDANCPKHCNFNLLKTRCQVCKGRNRL